MLSIHLCTFTDRRCETYGCMNHYGHAKYYIGRADVAVPKPVFCQSCIENMLATTPIEFGGVEVADHAAKIKEEAESNLQKALSEQKAQLESVFRAQYAALLASQPEPEAQAPVVEEAPKEETKKTYRCLDCGEDFKAPIALANHKKKMHKEG